MKLRRNKKGFTLVELVVVIAILAILASVATVATVTILNNARKTPVTDTASSVKNQIQYWYAQGVKSGDSAKFYTTSTTNNAKDNCLSAFIKSSINELNVQSQKVSNNKPAQAASGGLNIQCSVDTDLTTTASYVIYIASEYYYVPITVKVKDKCYDSISIGDPVRY